MIEKIRISQSSRLLEPLSWAKRKSIEALKGVQRFLGRLEEKIAVSLGGPPASDDRVRKGIAAMVAPTAEQKARGIIMETFETPGNPSVPTEPAIAITNTAMFRNAPHQAQLNPEFAKQRYLNFNFTSFDEFKSYSDK